MNHIRPTYEGKLTKALDPLEIRASAEQGLLTGHASKFWVADSYAEAVAPGAFVETIAQRGPQGANRILLRYEHEHTIGTHTKMAEDAAGLAIEGHVSDDGMWGTAVRKHLSDNVVYGISIGFRRLADRTAEDSDPLDLASAPDWVKTLSRNEIRVLTRVKLYENSVVSFPAVDPATVDSYRCDPTDIAALITAVKTGSLSVEQITQLKTILTDSPADGPQADGEMLAAARLTQTARRKRQADIAFLQFRATELGIGVSL